MTCVESWCSKATSQDGSDLPNVRIQRKWFGVQRPLHRRSCHKIRLNPTPKTSGNQFRNPTRNPICTQQSQNKPKNDFSEPARYLRSWNLKLASIYFPLSKKQKPTQAGQKQKKDSQVKVSEPISESPERGENAAKRERERERERELEEKNATGGMGGGREML